MCSICIFSLFFLEECILKRVCHLGVSHGRSASSGYFSIKDEKNLVLNVFQCLRKCCRLLYWLHFQPVCSWRCVLFDTRASPLISVRRKRTLLLGIAAFLHADRQSKKESTFGCSRALDILFAYIQQEEISDKKLHSFFRVELIKWKPSASFTAALGTWPIGW